ncbi:MAG: host attachment protein [Verrucomicrobia bacterium]|nr:host attachment protein [Verrucomicrobiota bacterium]
MVSTSLIIVADRGSLKAYRVQATPTRGPSLHLVQAFDLTDAHGRLLDKVTDQAGRFPVGDASSGRHMNAVAERTQLDAENDRRIFKQLAERIVEIVKGEGESGWSFAAPAPSHKAILDLLPANIRDRIVEYVKSDLVKIEPTKLIAHFRSLQSD